MWALLASAFWVAAPAVSSQALKAEGVSDGLARLFPSRAKTFVKASVDPDDSVFNPTQGNDDGFTGMNNCESYRTRTAAGEVAVLAHKAGRSGFMGCFFRNFWSDSTGLNIRHLERNRTQILIDRQVMFDMPLTDYFRSPSHSAGQIAPFSGPFTGGRSGGHLTHTPIAWENEFELRVHENAFANAGRFHKVCGTVNGPEERVQIPRIGDWEEVAGSRGAWPHATRRMAATSTHSISAGSSATVFLAGPATLLELTCRVGAPADWDHLTARFFWDNRQIPSVDVPLRVLGGMLKAPFQTSFQAMLFHNDGKQQITTYFPMPFRTRGKLMFVNTGSTKIQLDVTTSLARGSYPEPFGYFTASHQAGITQTGIPFQGPKFADTYGMLRGIMLESGMDTTGTIPGMDTFHLEGDLMVRINGNRGDDHVFAASETSIGKWGWYLSPADKPFVQDTSYHTGIIPVAANGVVSTRRLMGSTFIFDPILFSSGIDIRLEHGVQNLSNADYALTTFMYLDPGAARQRELEIDVGDVLSESLSKVQFDQHREYRTVGHFFRDAGFSSQPIVEDVRELRSFYRFTFVPQNDPLRVGKYGLGFRLFHPKISGGSLLHADIFVDGRDAGLLHVATSNFVSPMKEGGECEVEIPVQMTKGRASFTVEIRPRPGSAPVQLAKAWVYQYHK